MNLSMQRFHNVKKDITFFYHEEVEKTHWTSLNDEAQNRGYETRFSNDMDKKAEIGFYCSDHNNPENSKLSFVMLHGMDQGRNRWPNIWRDWPWHKFDIGLLPGQSWSNRWRASAFDPYAHPRLGVFEVGSPKADEIFFSASSFNNKINQLLKILNLPYDRTILYAPSFETDGKQKDIISLLRGKQVNLLIKQWIINADDKARHPDIWKNIKEANETILPSDNFIRVLPPDLSIMTCIGCSDILLTDESSVAYEALLLDLPSFTIDGWKIRTNNSELARPVKPAQNIVTSISKKDFLELIKDYKNEFELD